MNNSILKKIFTEINKIGIDEFSKKYGTLESEKIPKVTHYTSNIEEVDKFIVFENKDNKELSVIFKKSMITIKDFFSQWENLSANYNFRENITEVSSKKEGEIKIKFIIDGHLDPSSEDLLIKDGNGNIYQGKDILLQNFIFED